MLASLRTISALAPTLASVLLLTGVPAITAEQAGVWQYWNYPARPDPTGFFNADQYLTISKTGTTRFFAHQFYLNSGNVTYMGLQDTPAGKKAIFSVWDSVDAEPGNDAVTCEPFGGEGVGMKCHMPYEWEVGVQYRLRLWSTNMKDDKSTQWLGTVQNTQTGEDTFIGWIWAPAGSGYISSSVSWIEDYKLNVGGSCADETPASATFTLPRLNNGDASAEFGASVTSTCVGHSSRIDKVDGAAVLYE